MILEHGGFGMNFAYKIIGEDYLLAVLCEPENDDYGNNQKIHPFGVFPIVAPVSAHPECEG